MTWRHGVSLTHLVIVDTYMTVHSSLHFHSLSNSAASFRLSPYSLIFLFPLSLWFLLKMHLKSDSEISLESSTPPRSPRGRPLYFVKSPSQHDGEKMSYASSPLGSPQHYHSSPIHHSRESSSTTRFSASLKNPRNLSAWKKVHHQIDHHIEEEYEDDDDDDADTRESRIRFFVACFVFSFLALFTLFSLILWGVSKNYKPKINVKDIVFREFNVQAGLDAHNVATQLLTMRSTVNISYRNPGTFFGVHVSSTPMELYYYDLKLASGHMEEFSLSRKSHRLITTNITAKDVPLYGGLSARNTELEKVEIPLNLTFVVRSRAFVLGKLVKPKFYRKIRCSITLKGTKLGLRKSLMNSCEYH